MAAFKRLVALGAVAAVSAALLPGGARASGHRPPTFHPPQAYYLALGDSLAFGFQEAKFVSELSSGTYSAASFNTGYDADLAAMMQPLAPRGQGFHEINLGCPGETTTTMAKGPCPFPFPLHVSYPAGATQLQAAVAFLRGHRHEVNPITLDIGGNDLLNLVSGCSYYPACIIDRFPAVAATMAANLDEILTAIHDAAPNAEVIAMNVPDPYEFLAPASLQLFAAFNQPLNAVVKAHNIRLLDAYTEVAALYPNQYATFCSLAAICTNGDVHPTDRGYAVLASSFFAAAGYTKLS
jgi:lysophospholipase L1-like esterase